MSIIQQAKKPDNRPVIVTITGDAGMGKTTLAASFPKPLFIRAEDGLQAVPENIRPDALPIVENVDMLFEQLAGVATEEHDYQTLVIDSVSALERMFVKHVVDSDPKKPKSIKSANGGYGAGFEAVAALHQRLRHACGVINTRRNMHIVFIAHADVETLQLPDDEPYDRYSLRMSKKSLPAYVDDVDVVGFIKLKTFILGEEGSRKKAKSDGSRVLVTYATPANISKNRHHIADDLEIEAGKNPLAAYIPSLKQEK